MDMKRKSRNRIQAPAKWQHGKTARQQCGWATLGMVGFQVLHPQPVHSQVVVKLINLHRCENDAAKQRCRQVRTQMIAHTIQTPQQATPLLLRSTTAVRRRGDHLCVRMHHDSNVGTGFSSIGWAETVNTRTACIPCFWVLVRHVLGSNRVCWH